MPYTAHCPKNNLNLRIKTEPVTYELMQRFLFGIFARHIRTVGLTPSVTGFVILQRYFDYFWDSVDTKYSTAA